MPGVVQRLLSASAVNAVALRPARRCAGSKLLPDQNTTRLGSVPDNTEQWWLSHRVKASARAKWKGISARV
ncbi:hypothetical protein D3C86_1984790 [compost metagenome]